MQKALQFFKPIVSNFGMKILVYKRKYLHSPIIFATPTCTRNLVFLIIKGSINGRMNKIKNWMSIYIL